MKKFILFTILAMASTLVMAKDIKTAIVTTTPQMSCERCEQKIKGHLRFVRGIKRIKTNLKEQKVTIIYDADKTTVKTLGEAFDKIGYEVRQIQEDEPVEANESKQCPANQD